MKAFSISNPDEHFTLVPEDVGVEIMDDLSREIDAYKDALVAGRA